MGCLRDGGKVDIRSKLHVLSVNAQNLHASNFVGHANVDFTVKASTPTKSGINGVGSVCCAYDDDLSSSLYTVHKCQELSDNSLFNLTLRLLTVRSNGVDFVDEDDSWCVLLALLESFAKV